jgi:hypothetical protein
MLAYNELAHKIARTACYIPLDTHFMELGRDQFSRKTIK